METFFVSSLAMLSCSLSVSLISRPDEIPVRKRVQSGLWALPSAPQFVFVTQQHMKAVDPKKEVIGKSAQSAFIRTLTLASFLVPLRVCNWTLKAFICSLVETVSR